LLQLPKHILASWRLHDQRAMHGTTHTANESALGRANYRGKRMTSRYFLPALLAACALAVAVPASAQYTGPSGDSKGGYAGPAVEASKLDVASILANPKDDQNVVLQGKLLRKTGKEKYIFSDGTGEIVAEIDDDDFPKERIDENTNIEIVGEVDTGRTRPPEIEVDRVRVLK